MVAAVTVAVAVAAGAAVLWFRHLLDGPIDSSANFTRTVVVLRGTPYRAIVENLRSAGLLPHPFVFDYLAWRHESGGRLKPGRYQLRSAMSVRQVYQEMLRGAPIRITVPESWTIRQTAARLVEEGLIADADQFTSAACNPTFLVRHDIKAASAEGYILPETYLFDPGVTAEEILETMASGFERRYATAASRPRPLSLSWHEIITLASMIEREARNDEEKALIASVYYNRLRRGMTLNCDATLCYALSKWHEPLTALDLQTSSPYNTYLRKGLPPGPISCIGQQSVEAALAPAQTDYLYYCYKGAGAHQFSKTLAEHERAVEKFLRKPLTSGGGKK